MHQTQEIAVQRALALLKAAGAKFHVAIGEQQFGEPLFQKKKRELVNRGISAYIDSHIKDLEIGGITHIPTTEAFSIEAVRNVAASRCARHFGNENYITRTAHEGTAVEVMRVL